MNQVGSGLSLYGEYQASVAPIVAVVMYLVLVGISAWLWSRGDKPIKGTCTIGSQQNSCGIKSKNLGWIVFLGGTLMCGGTLFYYNWLKRNPKFYAVEGGMQVLNKFAGR